MNGLLGLIAKGYDPAAREAELNALKLQRLELGEYPEEKNWLLEKRGMERERFGWERQGEIERIANLPFKNQQDAMNWFKGALELANFENYDELRKVAFGRIRASGGDPSSLESIIPKNFSDPESFNQWKNNMKYGGELYLAEEKAKIGKKYEKETPSPEAKKLRDYRKIVNEEARNIIKTGKENGIEVPYSEAVSFVKPEIDKFFLKEGSEKDRSVHFTTDDSGNVIKIIMDAETKKTTDVENMGKIGKSKSVAEARGEGRGEEVKINKYNAAKKLLDEDYASMIGVEVNDLPRRMSAKQKKAYNEILTYTEKNLLSMSPREAVNDALTKWHKTFGKSIQEPSKVGGSSKERATQWLKDNNAPVTERNIEAVIKKFGW